MFSINKPVIAIEQILDTVWTIAFNPVSETEAEILALTRNHHETWDQINNLPIFHLKEGEGRTVTEIYCRSKLGNATYKVVNPKFIFSYPETIPTDIKPLKHFSFKVTEGFASFEGTCSTWASAAVNNITDDRKVKKALADLGIKDLKLSFELVNGNEPKKSDLRCNNADIQKPLYGVVWHYEGDTPALFTCRANDKDEAEALLYAELIDHESNSVEFYIDSIQLINL